MSSIIITRTTPATTAPYHAHKHFGRSPSNSSPTTSPGETHIEYRVELEERHRRTVFVTSDVPPERWETQHILDIADISQGDKDGGHEEYLVGQREDGDRCFTTVQRSKSLSERHHIIGITQGNSNRSRSAQDLPNNNHTQLRRPPSSTFTSSSSGTSPGTGLTPSRYQSRRISIRPGDMTNTAAAAAASKRVSISPTTPPNSPAVWRPQNSFARMPNSAAPRPTMVIAVPARRRILFYHKHKPYYGFTNFSAHQVMYNRKRYPTSEHLFQSFKFQGHRPDIAEHIRTCGERPSAAFHEARRFQAEVRPDWKKINVEKMEETIYHKFTQHADLLKELLDTGNAELVEDSDKDAFWGVGADGKGRNELGKALERLRAQLRGD